MFLFLAWIKSSEGSKIRALKWFLKPRIVGMVSQVAKPRGVSRNQMWRRPLCCSAHLWKRTCVFLPGPGADLSFDVICLLLSFEVDSFVVSSIIIAFFYPVFSIFTIYFSIPVTTKLYVYLSLPAFSLPIFLTFYFYTSYLKSTNFWPFYCYVKKIILCNPCNSNHQSINCGRVNLIL